MAAMAQLECPYTELIQDASYVQSLSDANGIDP
jgi:hypothetical protein